MYWCLNAIEWCTLNCASPSQARGGPPPQRPPPGSAPDSSVGRPDPLAGEGGPYQSSGPLSRPAISDPFRGVLKPDRKSQENRPES